jgi:S-DNA-T family DNA segregation ATPase FtsK/SpoIIIE
VSAIWTALAETLGTAARAFGNSARDLDPAHRRDGAGLLALCGAFITAAALWWHLGLIGKPLTGLLHGLFGSGAWTVPILLTLLAIRFLRHPDSNADTGRMVVGWTAMLAGALGLVHIADGTPGPAGGGAAMRAAGGLVGYVMSAPLVHLVSKWAGVPVLAAIAGFGLLVITGTPLHQVPGRLAVLHGFVWGQDRDEDELGSQEGADGEAGAASRGQLPRGKSRRPAAIEAGENDRPYDSPLLGGTLSRGQAGRGKAAVDAAAKAAAAPVPEPVPDGLRFSPPVAGNAAVEEKWRESWYGPADGGAPAAGAAAPAAEEAAAR